VYLTGLLTELLTGEHAYLLPCEAVFAYLTKQTPIAASVESMIENPRSDCSSKWGPVADFERYQPPDQERSRAMIERRFGLFRECGGLGE
jgi:exodeoxyribonuclease V gamma subunit